MDYKIILANAIKENTTQNTPYLSYFRRCAINAYEVDKEKFEDFFNSCKYIISLYKKEIEDQFNKTLNEDNKTKNKYKQMFKNGITYDTGGNSIEELIQQIEDERDIVFKLGYKNWDKYLCCIRSDNGEILENSYFNRCLIPYKNDQYKYDIFKLTYLNIEVIEKSLIECRAEILNESKFKDLTGKPKVHFSDYLINITDKGSFLTKIAPMINNQEAKQIAYLMIHLDIENYILFPKKRTEIYKIMRSDFSIITSNKSINDYLGKYYRAKEKSLIKNIDVISLFEESGLKITEFEKIKSLMQ